MLTHLNKRRKKKRSFGMRLRDMRKWMRGVKMGQGYLIFHFEDTIIIVSSPRFYSNNKILSYFMFRTLCWYKNRSLRYVYSIPEAWWPRDAEINRTHPEHRRHATIHIPYRISSMQRWNNTTWHNTQLFIAMSPLTLSMPIIHAPAQVFRRLTIPHS